MSAQNEWNKRNRTILNKSYNKWASDNMTAVKANNKIQYQKNKEKYKERHYLKTYGLTTKEVNSLIEAQNGHCAICPKTTGLSVDHDHVTGKVRQILCKQCNSMLGMARDNIATLEAGIEYLKKHKPLSS